MSTDQALWGAPEPLPAHTGSRRISWRTLPHSVSAGIEDVLGSTVTMATSQPGGFSEGLADRLELADGRRAFVKAVDTAAAPGVHAFHRWEIAVTGALPSGAPVPRLLGSYDDGQWVALVFEDIDGALPAQPWHEAELERVLDAVTGLADRLTPAPQFNVPLPAPRLGGWTRLARHPPLTGVEPEEVDVLISAQAGFLVTTSCSMGATTDPRLVRMMTQLGPASLRWLSTRRPSNK